ncbi:hypothetical protein L1049_007604 [Liquidambar formosana]|uniref:Response regulatory domain-containing protein n=1 Tax=Liquidambar formosana TaxID=63359 RepID=A0AAP0X1P1_LIQFO
MNADGNEKKELPELSRRVHNVNEKFMDVGVGEGQDLLEEDELRISRIAGDVKDGCDVANHAQVISQVPQQQQQQPQGSMVCWERFLHLRSLTVLLVENDDSTRHVVAALLRNCSYEVMEAANGLQAWKILEDLTKHIDLVLTEVVMPCLSGIGLLCKIMSHRTRKNIPVIMMSSHDSMGVVFKCLSKGAVDFLVKPIRKNELKNLWQHVWRRCHGSSGSGSESGSQTQKSVKSKRIEKSDNNTVSNDEDDNGSIGLNVGDGSDNGSGTQSSWTRRAVEVDSPQPASPSVQIAECPDSTCAQVIHSNAETLVNKWVPITATRRCHEQEEQLEYVAMGKDLEIGVPRNMDLQLEYSNESAIQLIGTKQNNLPEIGSSKFSEQIDGGLLGLNYESPSNKLICKATNLIGVITNTTELQMDSTEFESPNKLSMISEIDKAINDSKELPSLELSLKRLRGIKDIGTTVQDDRNVLRRSYLSAFSRYSTASSADKGSSKNIGTNSPLNNSLEVVKKEPVRNIQSHSNCNAPNRCSNEGSNNIDMGSTTNIAFTKPVVLRNKSATTSTVKSLHPSSTFQPIKIDHSM